MVVVAGAPPQFVLQLTCEREDVVDGRHQNVRLVNARKTQINLTPSDLVVAASPQTVHVPHLLQAVGGQEAEQHVELLCAGVVAVRDLLHDPVSVLAVNFVSSSGETHGVLLV